MSIITFVKYHGAGNDFILIDDRARYFPVNDALLIRKMCRRQFGIGADGVILLQLDSHADFQMRIFNSDGFEAESCGNGLRCLVHFLQELGIVQKSYRIKVGGRIVEAYLKQGRVVIDMGAPEKIRLGIKTELGLVHCIDTGVPHAVQFVSDVSAIDLLKIGALLRHNLQVNVDFASLQADRSIRVRTFERGVEGETLSCGTGAAAVGSVAFRLFRLKGPIPIHFPGGSLEVWEEAGRIFLSGPVEKVFQGSFPSPMMTIYGVIHENRCAKRSQER